MSKKKLLAAIISLTLVIAMVLPGTLATDATQAEPSADTTTTPEVPGTVQMPNEVTFVSGEKEGEKTTEGQTTETGSTGESNEETKDESEPKCNCEPVDGVHAATCPLNLDYKPAEETKPEGDTQNPDQTNSSENTSENPEKTCTCDPKPAEGEAHKEGCAFYVKPAEQPAELTHLDSCTAECTGENCACACHVYQHIMACTTLDEIWAILEKTPEAAFASLTEEQNAAIDAKITALEPEPAPEIVITPTTDVTVPSEIVYQTVNYTDVAPFGEPVTGGQN